MMRDPAAIQSEPLPEPPLDATTQATPAAQPVPEPQAADPAVQAVSESQPAGSSTADDPDFSDFLTAAFGESIVIEEIQD